jgi:beta-lactam-binding protein with PASTA domain
MPKKKLFEYLFYALLFLIVFFASAILVSKKILESDLVTIPDLTGKKLDEARKGILKKGLTVAQKDVQFNDDWERGLIISQDPPAGAKTQTNAVVRVVISGGSRKVTVPALERKSLEVVVQMLKEAGLVRGKLTQVHTPKYAAGRVMSQDPRASTEAERNTPVGLLVSQGEKEKEYVMPDLIAKKAERVLNRLKDLEFKVADVHYSYYPGLEPGIIIKQFPPSGYRIQKRNQITLEVSKE